MESLWTLSKPVSAREVHQHLYPHGEKAYHRTDHDYEHLLESGESMIYLAIIRLMVARLAGSSTQQQFAAPKA